MKILQINAVYGMASTGRTTAELHEALLADGFASVVASTTPIAAPWHLTMGGIPDEKCHAFFSRLTGKQAYFSRGQTYRLLRFMEKEQPDVVHLRNLHSNYIHLPLLLHFLAVRDIPTVLTLHDCWFYTGRCTHYIAHSCYRWQTGCHDCPQVKTANNPSWFFDRSARMWRDKRDGFSAIPRLAVVGVSDWVTQEARRSFLKEAAVVRRIYNWIDTDLFRPDADLSWRQQHGLLDRLVVLGVSQYWNEAKGISLITELARRMPTAAFVLVGQQEPGRTFPANVYAVGTLHTAEELARYYAMADVLVNPSRHETFGKTTAEALCCGTPVIGYDTTATPELIGREGGLVLPLDAGAAQWEQAVRTVEHRTKAAYETSCRASAEARFSKKAGVAAYERLYRDLLQIKTKGE